MPTVEQSLLAKENILVREMNRKYAEFNRLVKKKIKALGGLSRIKVNNEIFREFKKSLPNLMRRSGLSEISFDISKELSGIENIALRDLSEDLNRKLALSNKKDLRKAFLTGTDKQNTLVMRDQSAWFRKKLTMKSLKGISNDSGLNSLIRSLTKKSKAEIHTVVRTSVQGYDNAVVTKKANELGLDTFIYAGAKDSRNRPFCSDRVRKTFTDAEAKEWDNGQGLPADVYLGGYNCRHRKRYIRNEE